MRGDEELAHLESVLDDSVLCHSLEFCGRAVDDAALVLRLQEMQSLLGHQQRGGGPLPVQRDGLLRRHDLVWTRLPHDDWRVHDWARSRGEISGLEATNLLGKSERTTPKVRGGCGAGMHRDVDPRHRQGPLHRRHVPRDDYLHAYVYKRQRGVLALPREPLHPKRGAGEGPTHEARPAQGHHQRAPVRRRRQAPGRGLAGGAAFGAREVRLGLVVS
mmetsp:Transcript_151942/g.487685  ORF Transcript_151942/g.487685 Transcript_151942/m.487685 type:complete len:217 (-) Transcript_151942:250-900(-)